MTLRRYRKILQLKARLSPAENTENSFIWSVCILITCNYAPNFEKVDGAYCFWSVRGWVRAWVGGSHFLYLL